MLDFIVVLLAGIVARLLIQFYRDQNWSALAATAIAGAIIGLIIFRYEQKYRRKY